MKHNAESSGLDGENSVCLRFDTFDDSVNYFRKLAKDFDRATRREGSIFAHRYLNSNAYLKITLRSRFDDHKGNLTLRCVPFSLGGWPRPWCGCNHCN